MKTVKIVYPDDQPSSVKKAWITSETTLALETPRNKLRQAQDIKQASQPGLYFLTGEKDNEDTAYIGETGRGIPRLLTHRQRRDWWQRCIMFTSRSTDGEFDEVAAKYLERRAIKDAKAIRRYNLKQSNIPKKPTLPDYREADLEDVYEDVKMLLGVLNRPVLTPLSDDDEDVFTCSVDGFQARAQYTDEGMVVLEGSKARKRETSSYADANSQRRQELLAKGVLEDYGDHYEFTQDYKFSSPSTASSVCLGRQTNGWTTWEDEDEQTLDDVYR